MCEVKGVLVFPECVLGELYVTGVVYPESSVGICVYYVIIKQGADSILMVIGAFIQLLTTLFYSIGTRILMNANGADFYSQRWIYTIIGGIAFIGTLCFTVGFIVLIINHIKLHKSKQF